MDEYQLKRLCEPIVAALFNEEKIYSTSDIVKSIARRNEENIDLCFRSVKRISQYIQTTGNCHLVAVCVSETVKSMRDFVNMVNRKIEGITYISAHSVLDIIKGNIIPE